MKQAIRDLLDRLPAQPGVYIMKGERGEVLYIGKATSLRSRVRSYFSGNDTRAFVAHLDTLLVDIETIVTTSPKEALLLENTLIKRHSPRFNFKLRDDKNYLSIRIRREDTWPRVELVRSIRNDNATYFGPYHSASKVRQTLNVLNRHFHLRTCRDAVLRNRTRPCLQYQIKRCPAPCVLPVDRDAYLESVDEACLLLGGRERELVRTLTEKMERLAEDLRFEEAARLRDQIQAVGQTLERQSAVQTSQVDQDVIGMRREGERAALAVMEYRDGTLVDVRTYAVDEQRVPDADLLAAFLGQYYGAGKRRPPAEVVTPSGVRESEALELALTELRGSRCRVFTPQRGAKRKLVALANENASSHFDDALSTTAQAERALTRLQSRLKLPNLPRTIECYDISNLQGTHIVASQVVFQDAMPDRSRYRRLRVKTAQAQDDFLSLYEILRRRAKRVERGDPLPDLIVIDGGKGQLNAALRAFTDEGVEAPIVVGLAKSRVTGKGADDAATRSQERVFFPDRKNPVLLPTHAEETFLLERLRDEAHRTAIEYHRKTRRSANLKSALDAIPGVGPTRRKQLLKHFGSLAGVKRATLEELEAAPRMSVALAATVYAHFHPDAIDPPGDV